MKFSILSVSLVAATLTALAADQPNANPADNSASMKKALLEIQEQMQANEARHQAELDALKKQLTAQQAVIDSLQKNAAVSTSPPLPTGAAQTIELPKTGAEGSAKNAPLFPTTDESVVAGQTGTRHLIARLWERWGPPYGRY